MSNKQWSWGIDEWALSRQAGSSEIIGFGASKHGTNKCGFVFFENYHSNSLNLKNVGVKYPCSKRERQSRYCLLIFKCENRQFCFLFVHWWRKKVPKSVLHVYAYWDTQSVFRQAYFGNLNGHWYIKKPETKYKRIKQDKF